MKNYSLVLGLLIALFAFGSQAQEVMYPESEISCALFNNGDFKSEPYQEVRFSAKTVGDTASQKPEESLTWDANDRSYPYRYIRFRSAGYLIRGQRLFVPFAQGDVFLRLSVYRSVGSTDAVHTLIKSVDLKSKKDATEFEAKDSQFGALIKCSVNPAE